MSPKAPKMVVNGPVPRSSPFQGSLTTKEMRERCSLRNTITKFMAPTLEKASEVMPINFRTGLGDTTQLFAPSSDASETTGGFLKKYPMPREQIEGACQCFSLSDGQRAGFITKYDVRAAKIIDSGLLTNDFIAIDTYATMLSDEPDASRMILPARVMSDRRSPRNGSEMPLDADDDKISDLDEPDFIGSTTGPPATPTSTATLVSDASELGAESCVVCPRPLRKLIGHEFARLFEELEP
ncbi:hypothetical protein E4U30_003262 [Claviceps sp. LM220 group G6]|nr:hypothetical protein E4U30_003262 [Claviceps sp. LM220 group G6]